jgi:hypothetical protein
MSSQSTIGGREVPVPLKPGEAGILTPKAGRFVAGRREKSPPHRAEPLVGRGAEK